MKFKNLLLIAVHLFGAVYAKAATTAPAVITNAGVPTAGTNEVQTVTLADFAAGILSLKFRGQTATVTFVGNESNGTIDTTMDAALEALDGIGASGVTVSTSGTTDRAIAITFGGVLAGEALPIMTGSLTGAGTLTIAETTPGVSATAIGSPKGQLLVDTTNGRLYQNTGTADAPTWSLVPIEAGTNVLYETEIDASSELLALMDDETGTGALVFGTSPTFTTSAIFGAAGVSITDDADGAITFLGLGNGTDEDLKLNLDDTSNTAEFTSSTGVTTALFTGIGLNTTSTITATGAITPTGGVAAAGGYSASPRICHSGGVPAILTTSGTNTTDNTAGMVYLSEVFVPANVSVTGVAVFNGTAVAGNGKVALYDSTGARVAVSASTAMSGTTAYQLIAFTGAPIAVKGPATYFIGTIYDTTTHDLRGHVLGSFATGTDAGNTYATDSTFATVTLPTTFTADLGPIASLY